MYTCRSSEVHVKSHVDYGNPKCSEIHFKLCKISKYYKDSVVNSLLMFTSIRQTPGISPGCFSVI